MRQLLDGQRQYQVPLFQRPYAWEHAQHQQLWADVLELYEARQEEPAAQHFLGSVVTLPITSGPDRPELFILVDGQQRLTTLSVLLASIRDRARNSDSTAAEKLDALYLRNQFAHQDDRFKVLPTQADRAEFHAVMLAGAPTGHSRSMRSAFEFFELCVAGRDSEAQPIDFNALAASILDGLGLVSIALDDSDNAYRVFESLNATGLRLTQIDLIRNYLFMRLPPEVGEDAYRQVWLPMQESLGSRLDEFAHDYFTKDGEFVRQGEVYRAAKRRLDGLPSADIEPSLRDMAWFGGRWKWIETPELEPHGPTRERLRTLKQFGNDTVWPFVLNLYEARDRNGVLSAEEMTEVLRLLESFLVRRMFAGVPTNQLNRLFLRLWAQLPHEEAVPTEVRAALSETSRRWPRDEEFRADLETYPLYTDSRPSQRRLVLEALERSTSHKEQVVLDELTIEHVAPQTLTESWVAMLGFDWEEAQATDVESRALDVHRRLIHTLGNLTLTGYNPELSNDPWESKRDLYAASHVDLNREIATHDSWAEEQILRRASQLADRAIDIWPGPN